eukprot:sb/3467115/
MFVPALTYADAETQTDADEDYEDKTEVLRSVKLRTSQGTQMMERSPTPTPVCVDTACGPSTIDLITPVTPAPEPTPPPLREFTPPPPKPPGTANRSANNKSRAKSRKLKSRGMVLHTAKRAVSGRRSSHASVRPPAGSAGKSHPVLNKKQINFPVMKNKGPKEKWKVAAERIYMQQRVAKVKPAKSDKAVLGLKTAISEIKSFTLPPPAVYEVTKGILIIIGEDPESLTDWRKMTHMLGRHGPASPITRLVNLRNTPLNEMQMREGRRIVEEISLDEISKVSRGASVLYKWLARLTRYTPPGISRKPPV